MSSPTQRSLAEMRKRGYLCQVVEHWNPHVKIRQDLYGFVDILCVGEREVVAVQTTSRSGLSSRLKKIADHPNVAAVRRGGIRILVHGWWKQNGRWYVREEDVS
ncbi:MAG: hypothetical protein JSR67_03750 [Proteobacteria bacterium]|nr:hypothetical protein [Pseudomonadota bacterium]